MSSPPKPLQTTEGTDESTHASVADLVRKLTAQTKLGHFDELRDATGKLRPAWQTFFDYLGESGIQDLRPNADTVARLIQQNGVTYNVFADDQDQTRPWSLNPLPMLIGPAEWRTIRASLSQRAKLLNAILQDTYSEQSLIHDGYLPAALVLGNPGYLRSMRGVKPPGGIYLHVVAFDIARGPDGRWWACIVMR